MKRWARLAGIFLFWFFLSGIQVPSSLELPVLQVTDINLYNGKIYVLSYGLNRFFIYDLKGNLITSFGRKGQGPGEFMGAYKFFLDRDEIFVVDIRGRRIQVFDHSGKFKRTIRLKMFSLPNVIVIKKNVFYMMSQMLKSREKQIIIYRKNGGKEKVIATFPSGKSSSREFVFPPYSFPSISSVMDYLVVADLEKGSVNLYDVNGKPCGHFLVKIPRHKISKKWKENFLKKSKSAIEILRSRGIKVKFRENFPLMRRILPFGKCIAIEEWNEETPYIYHFFTLEGKEVQNLSFQKPVYKFSPPYCLNVKDMEEGIKIYFKKLHLPECLSE